MNSLENWGIPLFTSLLVHTAIMLLPVQYGSQTENKDVRELTFRLVSLPQKPQATPADQTAYQPPKQKPPPPEITHMQQQPSKPVRSKIAKIPVQQETGAENNEHVDSVSEPPAAVDLVAAIQPQAGNPAPGNMPTDLMISPTELSVICPELAAPPYPRISRQLGEYGDVVLRLEVSESGVVRSVQVVSSSGYKRLDEAAIEATRTWRCNPPRQNGHPVSAIALQPFKFVLQ
ncbi:MAG: TonB family protein [Nitrosomonas sp.]|nr:TonB family protein [Nitrosomonas sp.]MCW5608205.1 TonB family protein [Nitrosomonas sp.]